MEEPNALNCESIKRIEGTTIHRICSGQVVLSLAIAVKELVENAIDASATSIEIRLKEYGSESLDVSDNGTGVHERSFQALTLKHFTSKIREFTDLQSIETLGFRGEALSSLCALSELSILTKHATASYATRLRYDANCEIIESTPAARDVGTTVTLGNLFATLPVRRKEFVKNLKREYSKMCQLMYAYCLVSKGIRFTCSNFANGVRNTILSTEGSSTLRDNIISIFGPKQMDSLVQLDITEPSDQILEEYKINLVPGESLPFSFDCFISNAAHGCGRSTNDRQFFYINSRPCEPHKIMKLINSIYKQFNGNQYPFVYLNVIIQRSLVDVNVTPDKRQVFVDNEKLLLAVLKSSLLEAFKSCPSTYTVQNISTRSTEPEVKGVKRGLSQSITDLFKKRPKSESAIKDKPEANKLFRQTSLTENNTVTVTKTTDKEDDSEKNLDELILIAEELQVAQPELTNTLNNKPEEVVAVTKPKQPPQTTKVLVEQVEVAQPELKTTNTVPKSRQSPTVLTSIKQVKPPSRTSITIRSSLQYVKESLLETSKKNDDISEDITVNFHSQITPSLNNAAENELKRQFTKEKFKKMSVIGQFNLGFIIAQLENDLFIIDQHATDEKYNFENLQMNTTLDSQVLVNPKLLELTAANEELLIENEDMFKKNGFGFLIDRNAPATKKISLTSIPMSKNYIFGKNDIEEMLFMLQEGINPAICRPSRIQLMFATRACRKSVMVGCPLSKSDMRRLVDHMGEIDQPWNCPHGRPTMRHLVNLKLLDNK